MSITGMRTSFHKSLRLIFIILAAALLIGMVAYFGGGPGGPGPQRERETQTIATVGETQLTQREFFFAMDEQRRALGFDRFSERLTTLQAAGMRQMTFADLVTLTELAEEARVQGFSIDKKELRREKEKAIDRVIELEKAQAAGPDQEPISDADYKSLLRQRGITLKDKRAEVAAFMDDDLMRKRLMVTKLREKVEGQVKLSDKDLESFYAAAKVRHILVSTDKLPEAQAKTKAEKILAEVKRGKDFAALASEFSDDPATKEAGGELPDEVTWDSQYVSEFKRAALGLNEGETSGLVKTWYGYHIIQCAARKVEYPEDFEEKKKEYSDEALDAFALDRWLEYSADVKEKADKSLKIEAPEFAGHWALTQSLLAATPQQRDKKVEEAIGHLEKAIGAAESDAVVMCTLAIAYAQVGKKEEAAMMFARALQHTESADIEIQLGALYEELGETEKAVEAYDMASQVSYNKPDLLDYLAAKLEALGRSDLAQRNREDAARWRQYEAGESGEIPGEGPEGEAPPPEESAEPGPGEGGG